MIPVTKPLIEVSEQQLIIAEPNSSILDQGVRTKIPGKKFSTLFNAMLAVIPSILAFALASIITSHYEDDLKE